MISIETNDVFVSVVSIWEIAIKRQLGRKSSPKASAADLLHEYESNGINILGISTAHAIAVETLPSGHGDPFDRLLVAQAMTEPMHLLTRDRALAAYSDLVILV